MATYEEKSTLVLEGAPRYLDAFALSVDRNYRMSWHVELLARKLEDVLKKVERGEKARLIICMPPRHGKSDLASKKFPAWVLGKHADWPIIATSYAADLAVKFGLGTRDLMNSKLYQEIFPGTRLRADQKAKGNWLTEQGGGYNAAGVGGGITGKGFKIGIVDDPFKDRQEAESKLTRDNVWDWFRGVFYTRQEGIAAIIVIETRWHKDDLVGRLLEKEEEDRAAGEPDFDEWDVIELEAIAESKEEFRAKGDALWEDKFPLPILRNIKNTVGLYEWSAQYQQKPISSEIQEFKREWFEPYEPNVLLTIPGLKYYTLVDLGHKDTKEAGRNDPDNTCVRTLAKPATLPHWYLIEEDAGIMDPGATLDAIFAHQKRYNSEVWVEGVGYQRALAYFAREKMKRDQQVFVFNLLTRNNSVGKHERIRGLIPMAKNRFIKVRANGEDEAMIREALDFPKGKKDDRIDALANALEAVHPTQLAKKKKDRRQYVPLSKEIGG